MTGSVEGYQAKYFHYTCGGKGPTLTLVRSEHDLVFGGFTSVPWTRNIAYSADPTSFIFSLSRNTLHYPYRNLECAVRHHSGCLPAFGGGFAFNSDSDLFLAENCDKNRLSCCNLGETYSLSSIGDGRVTYGSEEARKYLAGSFNFRVTELEVFRVIFFQ